MVLCVTKVLKFYFTKQASLERFNKTETEIGFLLFCFDVEPEVWPKRKSVFQPGSDVVKLFVAVIAVGTRIS